MSIHFVLYNYGSNIQTLISCAWHQQYKSSLKQLLWRQCGIERSLLITKENQLNAVLSKSLTYFNVLFMPMCLPNTWIQIMTMVWISPREKALYDYSSKSSTNVTYRRESYCIYSLARVVFRFFSYKTSPKQN